MAQPANSRAAARERPSAKSWLSVDVVVEGPAWSGIAEHVVLVERAARALAQHPRFAEELRAEACVALSSDEAVRELNCTYRGKDKSTNVLSFPAGSTAQGEPGTKFLGDIVLAGETVLSEAREQIIPADYHLQHLVVHGLLHLLGFDHETDKDAGDMEALETGILASIGIPNPYAGDGAPDLLRSRQQA